MKYWIQAIRPKTLSASIAPVLIALAYCSKYGAINIFVATLTLCCSLLLQISSNLINDYYDGIRGHDLERIGPKRFTGEINPNLMKRAFSLTLIFSFLIGLYLMSVGGVPIILIGLSSLAFAYIYTGSSFALSHYALGEILAFLFFGVFPIWGSAHLQQVDMPWSYTLAYSFLPAKLMAINNVRDRLEDKKNNKITLIVLLGEKSRYIPLLFSAFALLGAFLTFRAHALVFLIPWLFCWPKWKLTLKDSPDSSLNLALDSCGKYLILYALVWSILEINR